MIRKRYQLVLWSHLGKKPKVVLRSQYYSTDTRALLEKELMECWVDHMDQYSIEILELRHSDESIDETK